MKNNEHWVLLPQACLERVDTPGPDPRTGEPTVFPYRQTSKLFLHAYHAKTKKLLHAYGPFADAGEVEAFAREHHIDLKAK